MQRYVSIVRKRSLCDSRTSALNTQVQLPLCVFFRFVPISAKVCGRANAFYCYRCDYSASISAIYRFASVPCPLNILLSRARNKNTIMYAYENVAEVSNRIMFNEIFPIFLLSEYFRNVREQNGLIYSNALAYFHFDFYNCGTKRSAVFEFTCI